MQSLSLWKIGDMKSMGLWFMEDIVVTNNSPIAVILYDKSNSDRLLFWR